uniref:LamG-like jellyroll fold domain-containing protein n=1 Tax=Prymnesium polylepis TaxID=72548 RepID=A0A7S4JJR1_9EUKA
MPVFKEIFPFAQTSCMDFLGNSSQIVSIKPTGSITGIRCHFALEAIIMPRSFGGHAPILTRTDSSFKSGWGLVGLEHPAFKGDVEEGPFIHFFFGNWSPSGGGQEVHTKIEYDQWIHVAGVYNGNELRIYVNGSFKDQLDYISSDEEMEGLQAKGDVAIGAILGKYAFDGYIDECRLWDVERSEDQIKGAINKPIDNNTPGLLGQWTFNEGAGEVIVDSSGHRNHALFERYAGGVELRRVQSRRPWLQPDKSAREKMIDANFLKLQKWRKAFESSSGRPATKADIMLADPEIKNLALRMGELF